MKVKVNENDGKHGPVKAVSDVYIPPDEKKVAESEKKQKPRIIQMLVLYPR